MDSWNISFLLGGMTCFQGRSVGFRECNFSNFKLFRKITTEIEWLNTPIHLMFNWKLAFVSNKSGQWGVSDSNILNFPLTSPPKFQMFFCTRVFLVHRGSRKNYQLVDPSHIPALVHLFCFSFCLAPWGSGMRLIGFIGILKKRCFFNHPLHPQRLT